MQELADAAIRLGKLVLRLGQTNRSTFFEDGTTPESDTDHTVMVGILACAFAAKAAPHLDIGKIAQMALVHDLVEAYAGDTPTLGDVPHDVIAAKKAREHAALERIKQEFGETFPWVHETIEEYEKRASPEARFVKTIDKMIPSVTHALNGGQTIKNAGLSKESLRELRMRERPKELEAFGHDQLEAMALRDALFERVYPVLP